MRDIPSDILKRFSDVLRTRSVPSGIHSYYLKWLRYYVDFCRKYHFHESERESLPHFIKKLEGKNQTQEQQKQASHAVSLYYELIQSGTKKETSLTQPLMSQRLTEENNVSVFRQEKKDTPLNPLLIEGKFLSDTERNFKFYRS